MELREFVAKSLADIIRGVQDAQAQIAESGARVNPRLRRIRPSAEASGVILGWSDGDGGNPVLLAEFDVAVTANEGNEVQAGVGVLAGVVSFGSKGKTEEAVSSASRIKFRVPVLLPPDGQPDAG